jgi:hypothetical protein
MSEAGRLVRSENLKEDSGLRPWWLRHPRARVALLAVSAFLVARVVSISALFVAGHQRGMRLGELVTLWDGVYYRATATVGYVRGAAQVAFFPLFPLLTKPFLALGMGFATAGLLVVLLTEAVAAVIIALVALELGGERVAVGRPRSGVHSPLHMRFPSPTVTPSRCAGAGCLLALLKRRWLTAALCTLASAAGPP